MAGGKNITGDLNVTGTLSACMTSCLCITSDTNILCGSDLRFVESGAGCNYIALQAPAAIAACNFTLTLPVNAGSCGQVLSSDGTGVLSWVCSGGGTCTSVFNDSAACALTTAVIKFDFLCGLAATEPIANEIDLILDITSLTDLAAPAIADELALHDCGVGIRKADIASVVNLADHDALTNFLAAEHVDWAGACTGTISDTNLPTTLAGKSITSPTLTGNSLVTGGGEIRFVDTGAGCEYIGFKAPVTAVANSTWILPADAPIACEVLSVTSVACGNPTLEWKAAGGGGGLSKTGTPTDNYLVVWDGTGACICVVQPPNANVIVNQNLIPASATVQELGSSGVRWGFAYLNAVVLGNAKGVIGETGTSPSGATIDVVYSDENGTTNGLSFQSKNRSATTNPIYLETGNNTSTALFNSGLISIGTGTNTSTANGASGDLCLFTGVATGATGCQTSGDINLTIGDVTSGTRGVIKLDAPEIRIMEDIACPVNYRAFSVSGAVCGNETYVLPSDMAASCEYLKVSSTNCGVITLAWDVLGACTLCAETLALKACGTGTKFGEIRTDGGNITICCMNYKLVVRTTCQDGSLAVVTSNRCASNTGCVTFKSGFKTGTGNNSSGIVRIQSGHNATTAANGSGDICINTGNANGATGATLSGDINLTTGAITSACGVKGLIQIHDTKYYSASIQTTNACATTILDIPTVTCESYFVKAKVIGVQNDGTDSSAFEIYAKFKNSSGTLSKAGETSEFASEDNASTAFTVAVSTTNIRIQVTGIAAETYDWILNVEVLGV